MALWQLTDEQLAQARQQVQSLQQQALRRAMIARVERSAMAGEVTQADALQALTDAGVSGPDARALVLEWDREARVSRRSVGVAQLCSWYGMGLLTEQDWHDRLRSMGYEEADARIIISACVSAEQSKERKAAEQRAAKAQANQQRARKMSDAQLAAARRDNLARQKAATAGMTAAARAEAAVLKARAKLAEAEAKLAKAQSGGGQSAARASGS
jgi:hypothetical protein